MTRDKLVSWGAPLRVSLWSSNLTCSSDCILILISSSDSLQTWKYQRSCCPEFIAFIQMCYLASTQSSSSNFKIFSLEKAQVELYTKMQMLRRLSLPILSGWLSWKQLQESNCWDKDEQNPFCQKEYRFIYGGKLQFCYDSIIKKKKKKPSFYNFTNPHHPEHFFFPQLSSLRHSMEA